VGRLEEHSGSFCVSTRTVTIETNVKSYVNYQMAPIPMTFRDPANHFSGNIACINIYTQL